MTKKEFCVKLFGTEEVNRERLDSYFKDWIRSSLSLEIYKALLNSRG
jgi:hypothetical protein